MGVFSCTECGLSISEDVERLKTDILRLTADRKPHSWADNVRQGLAPEGFFIQEEDRILISEEDLVNFEKKDLSAKERNASEYISMEISCSNGHKVGGDIRGLSLALGPERVEFAESSEKVQVMDRESILEKLKSGSDQEKKRAAFISVVKELDGVEEVLREELRSSDLATKVALQYLKALDELSDSPETFVYQLDSDDPEVRDFAKTLLKSKTLAEGRDKEFLSNLLDLYEEDTEVSDDEITRAINMVVGDGGFFDVLLEFRSENYSDETQEEAVDLLREYLNSNSGFIQDTTVESEEIRKSLLDLFIDGSGSTLTPLAGICKLIQDAEDNEVKRRGITGLAEELPSDIAMNRKRGYSDMKEERKQALPILVELAEDVSDDTREKIKDIIVHIGDEEIADKLEDLLEEKKDEVSLKQAAEEIREQENGGI